MRCACEFAIALFFGICFSKFFLEGLASLAPSMGFVIARAFHPEWCAHRMQNRSGPQARMHVVPEGRPAAASGHAYEKYTCSALLV